MIADRTYKLHFEGSGGLRKVYDVAVSRSERENRSDRSVLLRALLLVDGGDHRPRLTEKQVSEATGLACRPIDRLKKRFVEEGLDAALERKRRETPPNPVKFDSVFEARLIAPPEGRSRWTVRLLADTAVKLAITDTVSPMTVCKTLKKRASASPLSVLENPARPQRGLRSGNGGRAGGLQQALRSSRSRAGGMWK